LIGRDGAFSPAVMAVAGAVVLGQSLAWRDGPSSTVLVVVIGVLWCVAASVLVWRGIRRGHFSPMRRCALLLMALPVVQEWLFRSVAGQETATALIVYPLLTLGAALVLSLRWFQVVVAAALLAALLFLFARDGWTALSVWQGLLLVGLTGGVPFIVWQRLHLLRRQTARAAASVLEERQQRERFLDPVQEPPPLLFQTPQQEQAAWLHIRFRERGRQLLEVLKQALPQVRSCVLFLYQPSDDRLHLELCVGGSPQDYRDELSVAVGHGPIGWAAKERKPCLYARLDPARQSPDYYRAPTTVRSLMVMPMAAEGRLEGVLCIDSQRTGVLGDREEQLLLLTAGCLRAQLEDLRQQRLMVEKGSEISRLLEASQLLNSRLDLQHRLETMTGLTQKIVQADTSILCLVDEGERRAIVRVAEGHHKERALGQSFPLTDGLVSLVVKNRQPVLLSHLSDEQPTRFFPSKSKLRLPARSFLGLPLIVQDRVIGLLLCLSDAPSAFTATHQHLLSILCNQAAQAITDAQLHEQVERLASIDGLTTLLNHRAFHGRLHYEWEQAQRHGEALALMMIDLDHFKRINDTHGHQAGDRILKQVAALLKQLARKVDTVGRYGGEEFAILLPKTTAAQAGKMGERIRKVIERGRFGLEGVAIPVTLSIGVASAPTDATGPDQLVSVADKALYGAKAKGRNRVMLSAELTSALARTS
jgi:diguanylate cyclase (GGDEF)-like protein